MNTLFSFTIFHLYSKRCFSDKKYLKMKKWSNVSTTLQKGLIPHEKKKKKKKRLLVILKSKNNFNPQEENL